MLLPSHRTLVRAVSDRQRFCEAAGIAAVLAAGMRLSRSFALPAPPSCKKVKAIGRQTAGKRTLQTVQQRPLQRCRCHAPSGCYGPWLPATAHRISPVPATAGTVPGRGTVVAVSVDSPVCDDSTVQPTAAGARPPPCPRGQSPVPHRMMRIPIKSQGFSLQVPCISGP